MAEDKKTRLELEEQKNIANDVRRAFGDASGRLRQGYSAEIQKVLDEIDAYNGSVLKTDSGKSLKSFLGQEDNRPSDFFRKFIKKMPGWVPDYLLEDFYLSIDLVTLSIDR